MPEKITLNFNFQEFKPYGAPDTWVPESEYQRILIVNLAKNLQIVRSAMQPGCSLSISCGVRTSVDYDRLVASGYHPSETSDHYCGNVVSISPSSPKYKKFGPDYYLSCGAADVIPKGMDIELFFKMAASLTLRGMCKFGQVIYEQDFNKKTKWVHFSNDYSSVFTPSIVSFLGKEKFLTTVDGGMNYTKYIPT